VPGPGSPGPGPSTPTLMISEACAPTHCSLAR
jgi:hypothetical protein